MKIIKEGRPIQKTMEVTCKYCGAVLEMEAGDFELVKASAGDNSPVKQYWYVCPWCQAKSYLKHKDVPEDIRRDVKWKTR